MKNILLVAVCVAAANAAAVRWFEEKLAMPDGVRLYTFGTAL